MHRAVRVFGIIAIAALLASCSSGRKTYFKTEGLIAPPSQCLVKPAELGLAEKLRAIDEGNGCEIPNPWRIQSVSNVTFSRPAVLNCSMASPLDQWFTNSVQPAAERNFGEEVVSVDVLASYSCRPRNNQYGAKMSEHGFGNAIDIGAFTLASGRKVTVLDGWNGSAEERTFLRQVRQDACGDFKTVLGPGSDAEHRNHLHLDLQTRRSGSSYCR